MGNNIKSEMQKLCDMQIVMWHDIKNALDVVDGATEEEISAMFNKYLRETHHEAVLQLVRVKIALDKIDGVE